MHDMNCTEAKDMYYKDLADKVGYYKDFERGENNMCEIMEELFAEDRIKIKKETSVEIAINLLKKGVPVDVIAESLPALAKDFVEGLAHNIGAVSSKA